MPSYNATIELAERSSERLASRLVDELADYHPAVSRSATGRQEIIITVPADTLRQAITTALAVVTGAGQDPYGIEVLPTEEFDRRVGLEPVPELLSITEAAAELGVTRQAVQQRIDAGSLPAQRVGNAWAVLRSAVLPQLNSGKTLGSARGTVQESASGKTLGSARGTVQGSARGRVQDSASTKVQGSARGKVRDLDDQG